MKTVYIFDMDANVFKLYLTESAQAEVMAIEGWIRTNNPWKCCYFEIWISREQSLPASQDVALPGSQASGGV